MDKKMKIASHLLLSVFTSSIANANDSIDCKGQKNLHESFAEYLTSLDPETRARLGSEIYYLDSSDKSFDAKKTLFEELLKSGRLKHEKTLSTGPRTISCDTGDSD